MTGYPPKELYCQAYPVEFPVSRVYGMECSTKRTEHFNLVYTHAENNSPDTPLQSGEPALDASPQEGEPPMHEVETEPHTFAIQRLNLRGGEIRYRVVKHVPVTPENPEGFILANNRVYDWYEEAFDAYKRLEGAEVVSYAEVPIDGR